MLHALKKCWNAQAVIRLISKMFVFWALKNADCSAVLGARRAAKEVCTMTALHYRTTTKRQRPTTMAQTERAANQGHANLRLDSRKFMFL